MEKSFVYLLINICFNQVVFFCIFIYIYCLLIVFSALKFHKYILVRCGGESGGQVLRKKFDASIVAFHSYPHFAVIVCDVVAVE